MSLGRNKVVYERHSREWLNLIACILPPNYNS